MPPFRDTITSVDNPLVKRLVALHQARNRKQEGRFLAEGQRTVSALLGCGCSAEMLLVRDDLEVPGGWPANLVCRISQRVADRISQVQTCSGYLGLFAPLVPKPLDPAAGGLVLVEVQDPGNVGTLLRSAAAFGVAQVVLVGGADPFSAKTIQASAGAIASTGLHVLPAHTQPDLLAAGAALCALVVSGGKDPAALPRGPRWLLVGSESHGLRTDWTTASQELVTVPMQVQVESLNAAVAGSIAVYLLSR